LLLIFINATSGAASEARAENGNLHNRTGSTGLAGCLADDVHHSGDLSSDLSSDLSHDISGDISTERYGDISGYPSIRNRLTRIQFYETALGVALRGVSVPDKRVNPQAAVPDKRYIFFPGPGFLCWWPQVGSRGKTVYGGRTS
jgi:hypothetical protein